VPPYLQLVVAVLGSCMSRRCMSRQSEPSHPAQKRVDTCVYICTYIYDNFYLIYTSHTYLRNGCLHITNAICISQTHPRTNIGRSWRPHTKSFLEAGFRPLDPSFVWFVPLYRTKGVFWIRTRTRLRSQQPGPSWLPGSTPDGIQEGVLRSAFSHLHITNAMCHVHITRSVVVREMQCVPSRTNTDESLCGLPLVIWISQMQCVMYISQTPARTNTDRSRQPLPLSTDKSQMQWVMYIKQTHLLYHELIHEPKQDEADDLYLRRTLIGDRYIHMFMCMYLLYYELIHEPK